MKENAETYILSKLEELRRAIPTLKILYKKDTFTREYLVKVIPCEEVETSELYQELESEIIFDFITKYPFDSVVFMTEDEWIDVRDPEQVFVGDEYVEGATPTFADNDLFVFQKQEDDFFNVSGIFPDYKPALEKHFGKIVTQSSLSTQFDEWLIAGAFCVCAEPEDIYGVIGNQAVVESHPTEEDDCNCENYALAA